MTIPPVMILALFLVGVFGLYLLVKVLAGSKSDKPGKGGAATGAGEAGAASGAASADDPAKAAALEQFRAAHAAARDKRKQLQKAVQSDPTRATKALRSLMKR